MHTDIVQHRIVSLARSDGGLRLRFNDGVEGVFDPAPLVVRGGVFTRLADPAYLAAARIGENGRSLEFPDDVDFCADALWLKAQANAHAPALAA
jgi:hypothetical protein